MVAVVVEAFMLHLVVLVERVVQEAVQTELLIKTLPLPLQP
jgi:hypothetical protein